MKTTYPKTSKRFEKDFRSTTCDRFPYFSRINHFVGTKFFPKTKEIMLKTPTNRELIMPTFEENLGSLMRALDQA
jgi:hypothetical protein